MAVLVHYPLIKHFQDGVTEQAKLIHGLSDKWIHRLVDEWIIGLVDCGERGKESCHSLVPRLDSSLKSDTDAVSR